MDAMSWIVIIGGLLICALVVYFGTFSLRVCEKSIFHGSGVPAKMAQMVLSSVHITSQVLFSIFVIVILILLMLQEVITTDAGLPLLSAVAGYILGKNFRDVALTTEDFKKKTNNGGKLEEN